MITYLIIDIVVDVEFKLEIWVVSPFINPQRVVGVKIKIDITVLLVFIYPFEVVDVEFDL